MELVRGTAPGAVPESAQEAAMVERIIKHFRTEMYPDVYNLPIGSTGVSADLGFKFPNVFQISFNYKNALNKKLPQLQLCYLRNVSHTVNPTGVSTRKFPGGYPWGRVYCALHTTKHTLAAI